MICSITIRILQLGQYMLSVHIIIILYIRVYYHKYLIYHFENTTEVMATVY